MKTPAQIGRILEEWAVNYDAQQRALRAQPEDDRYAAGLNEGRAIAYDSVAESLRWIAATYCKEAPRE